jgi:hypothetical protein
VGRETELKAQVIVADGPDTKLIERTEEPVSGINFATKFVTESVNTVCGFFALRSQTQAGDELIPHITPPHAWQVARLPWKSRTPNWPHRSGARAVNGFLDAARLLGTNERCPTGLAFRCQIIRPTLLDRGG